MQAKPSSIETLVTVRGTVPVEDVSLPTEGNNPSLTFSNADTTVTSTIVITKTIGTTEYTKTISKNAAGDVVSISAWS